MTVRCPSCAFENASGIKFCGNCGTALKLRCRECGFENSLGVKFCGECGHRLPEPATPEIPREPRS